MFLSGIPISPWFAVITICLLLALRRNRDKDGRTPPVAPSSVPYFGHLFMYLRHGHYAFCLLREKIRVPVYSINLLSQQVYVVNDLRLVSLLQRDEKKRGTETMTVSDRNTVVATVHGRMFGNNAETMKKIRKYGENGEQIVPSHRQDMHDLLHTTLAPGPVMTQIYLDNMNVVAHEVEALSLGAPQRFALLAWLQEVVALSAAASLYGPENPFASSKDLVRRLWDFDSGVVMLMYNILPRLTVPAALKAREVVVKRLKAFLLRNGESQEEYSELVRNRLRINGQYDLSDDGNAREELGMMFAMTTSTNLAMFWMIAHILCDRSLHAKVLDEIRDVLVVRHMETHHGHGDDSQTVQFHLDIKVLKRSCPVLMSTYQEILRTNTASTMSLHVERDFLLDNRYLLRKEGIVIIPGYSIHMDPEIWGPDAHEFEPERFMPIPGLSSSSKKQPSPSVFRSFGGGAEMCPGRHLAMDLILAFTAVVLYSFDITPGDTEKGFKLPEKDVVGSLAVVKPIGDFDIVMNPRVNLKGVRWKFE